jgi:hypothetical protein
MGRCAALLVGILVERFKLSRRILRIFSSNKYFNFFISINNNKIKNIDELRNPFYNRLIV